VLQPAAQSDAPSSPVPEDHVLYEAEVSLWENDQYAPMIAAAVQRHVSRACAELQPLLDLAREPTLPTPSPYANPYANSQPKPNDKIDIDIILRNALSALRDDYLSNLPGALNPDAVLALHRSVGAIPVGDTTIGVLWELDKQVFDLDAEQASFGLSSPLPPDPQRFV